MMIQCELCGQIKKHCAKGLCHQCYNKIRWQTTKNLPTTDLKIISKYDENGNKICQRCGYKLSGKQKKYCNKCKPIVHKEQMKKQYEDNKDMWLKPDGRYANANCTGLGRATGQDHWNYNQSVTMETKIKIWGNILKI